MIKRSFSFFYRSFIISTIVLLLTIGSFLLWVITGPRSLQLVAPYVEEELNTMSGGFDVRMESSYIKWDSLRNAVSISIHNVKVLNATNELVADCPELLFDFSIWRVLRGHLLSSDVSVLKPTFYINSAYQALYTPSESTKQAQENFFIMLYDHLASKSESLSIHNLRVRDADFFISNGFSDLVWHVKEGYARMDRYRKGKKIVSEFTIDFGSTTTYFDVKVAHARDNLLDFHLHFEKLPSYAVTDIFPRFIDTFERIEGTASATIDMLLSPKGEVPQMQVNIANLEGVFRFPEYFKKDVYITSLKGQGNFYDNFSQLAIDSLSTNLEDANIGLSGTFKNTGQYPEIKPEISAELSATNFPLHELDNYWPIGLAEHIRSWITTNITSGTVTNGKGKFHFTADDIQHIKEWTEQHAEQHVASTEHTLPIPDSAIDASIDIENAQISYLPHYPQMSHVNSTVHFSGHSMQALIKKAEFAQTTFTDGSVTFPDMWAKPVTIEIASQATGKAENLLEFLKASMESEKITPILDSLYKTTGDASGTFKLTLPIVKELTYPQMNLHIDGKFTNTQIPKLHDGKDLSNAAFSLLLDNNTFQANGSGVVDKLPIEFDYKQSLVPQPTDEYDYKYQIKTTPDASQLALLGVDAPYVSGPVGIDITYATKDKAHTMQGNITLKDAQVAQPAIGFNKAKGTESVVSFEASHSDGSPVDIHTFSVKGPGTLIEGNAKLSPNFKEVISADFPVAKYGRNNLAAHYYSDDAGFKLSLKGASMDIAPIDLSQTFRNNNAHKKKLDIIAELNTVYLKNNESLNDFTLNINCAESICQSVNMYGKLHDTNYLVMSMKPLGDRSSLMIESDNAGAVISGAGISEHINNGTLFVNSTFVRRKGSIVAQGVIHINDFKAVKTPILGKLLTLASFKGILDLLDQQGITFAKFEAPFQMSDGIITVKDAKSSGASVGITAEGTVNTNDDTVDIRGVIVPAYALNTVLGNIPVVGKILVGKKNEGVLATRYSVRGPYQDAKTSVNPLSILAPGFLRNIFDVFQNEKPKPAKKTGK